MVTFGVAAAMAIPPPPNADTQPTARTKQTDRLLNDIFIAFLRYVPISIYSADRSGQLKSTDLGGPRPHG